ncbi:MAG: trimethylamine methyltransferase family protein, partial [Anaerolineales bacterium]|nr:trimethylamine methyltransferase family protein [Anaerolineales bacterium]
MTTTNRDTRRRARAAHKSNALPPGLEGGQYRPLSEAAVQRIHEGALSILERTGVEIFDSECRSILAAAGARVDAARDRVYLPRQMVAAALKLANHDVVLYSQDGRMDLH